jgi:hypothetical protein
MLDMPHLRFSYPKIHCPNIPKRFVVASADMAFIGLLAITKLIGRAAIISKKYT